MSAQVEQSGEKEAQLRWFGFVKRIVDILRMLNIEVPDILKRHVNIVYRIEVNTQIKLSV